jgi:hypothetical protein
MEVYLSYHISKKRETMHDKIYSVRTMAQLRCSVSFWITVKTTEILSLYIYTLSWEYHWHNFEKSFFSMTPIYDYLWDIPFILERILLLYEDRSFYQKEKNREYFPLCITTVIVI